jgi:hypothetical protein
VRIRKTYLSGWYWKTKQRRGGKKALIALSRKILTIIYSLLKDQEKSYDEKMYESLQERLSIQRQEKMIKELIKKGYNVTKFEKMA